MSDKLMLRLRRIGQYLKSIPDYFLLRSSDLFDVTWYLEHNPDVALAGGNPVWHYLTQGGSEGRDPSPRFCSRRYLDAYKDVKEAGINPLVHYLKHCRTEGRIHSALGYTTSSEIKTSGNHFRYPFRGSMPLSNFGTHYKHHLKLTMKWEKASLNDQ